MLDMNRLVFVALVALLGGCSPLVSVSGKVYGTDQDALLLALRDSGSVSLKCPLEQVRVRVVSAGSHGNRILLAEGCDQRAAYVMDCPPHVVYPTPSPCFHHPPETTDCQRVETNECELILVSRGVLD